MVVVKTFASRQKREPLDVAGSIGIGAPSEMMAESIHGSRRSDVEIGVNESCNEASPRTKNNHQRGHADAETQIQTIVEQPIPAVGRKVARVP